MNMLTGFSAYLCDVVQKPRRWQKLIATILFSERTIVTFILSEHSNDAFKSYFCDRMRLSYFWSDRIFVIVRAKGLITLLLYCSKG